jgi:hypothetical protein
MTQKSVRLPKGFTCVYTLIHRIRWQLAVQWMPGSTQPGLQHDNKERFLKWLDQVLNETVPEPTVSRRWSPRWDVLFRGAALVALYSLAFGIVIALAFWAVPATAQEIDEAASPEGSFIFTDVDFDSILIEVDPETPQETWDLITSLVYYLVLTEERLGRLKDTDPPSDERLNALESVVSGLSGRLTTAQASIEALEEAQGTQQPPDEEPEPVSSIRTFMPRSEIMPAAEEPEEVHRRFARVVDEAWIHRWETARPKIGIWVDENPDLVIRGWYNSLGEGESHECLNTGEVLLDEEGAPIHISGYLGSMGEGVSNVARADVAEEKASITLEMFEASSPLWNALFLDNTSVNSLSGFGLFTAAPAGITEQQINEGLAYQTDLICLGVPRGVSVVGNVGHWVTPPNPWDQYRRQQPDLWAAEWLAEREKNFTYFLEGWPQWQEGFGLVASLKVTSAFDRPWYAEVTVTPEQLADQEYLLTLWTLFAMVRDEGCALAISPRLSEWPSRHDALMDWLDYKEQLEPSIIAAVERLGERQEILWPEIGSWEREVRVIFQNGEIIFNSQTRQGVVSYN